MSCYYCETYREGETMKLLIISTILCLSVIGCNSCRIEDQIPQMLPYHKVFINTPTSITVVYKQQDQYKAMTIHEHSFRPITFIEDGNNYIEWNEYRTHRYDKYDIIVHMKDISDIGAGEKNKGKFGTEKLKELR